MTRPVRYRPSRGEGRFSRLAEAILDWPIKIAELLLGFACRVWDWLPRWLAIPVVTVLGLVACYFLAHNVWYWTVGYDGP